MRAYAEEYLNDVVENQGKLFDLVAQQYSDKDTEEFINTYMASKTRKSIDEAKAYVNTMDAKELSKISSAIFISERKPIRLPTLLGNCCSNAWTIICRTFVVGSGSMLPCPS